MSDEKRALSRPSAPPSEADYEAILAAVMETGRGRWFLHEFAQRNRHAETRGVLDAIARLERLLQAQAGEVREFVPLSPATDAIAAAITRAQAMLGLTGDTAAVPVVQALEEAHRRLRLLHGRLQDAVFALHEEGASSRLCADLDRQAADLDTACAALDDAAGDVRILVGMVQDIAEEAARRQVMPAEPDPAAPALEPVQAETAPDAADDTAPPDPAPAADEAVPIGEAVPASETAPMGETAPMDESAPDMADAPEATSEPAEPIEAEEPDDLDEAEPLPLPHAFDPLAPLRALSEDEKIALFS